MGSGSAERGTWLLALMWLAACSPSETPSARDVADANDTGRTLSAENPGERAVLARVATLPNGKAVTVSGLSVTAEPQYAAASGRTCRALSIVDAGAGRNRNRVACSDGKSWFFVPDVFSGNDGS